MAAPVTEVSTPDFAPRVLGPVKRRVSVTELWTSRRVAWMLGMRDIKAKYKQAALGPLWLIIAPLGMLAAVTVAFSGVTDVNTTGVPYLLFALCGLTVWTFLQLSLTIGTQAIVANSQLVRRSPMPRVALMTGSMLGNLPPAAVMLTFTLLGTAIFHHLPVQVLLVPLLAVWLAAFTMGVTMLVSALAAQYRDAVAAMPLIIQAGIFVTPVGYGLAGAPSNIHTLLMINPATGIIEAWRWSVLDIPDPSLAAIGIAAAWTIMLVSIGWRVFGRMEVDFADYV